MNDHPDPAQELERHFRVEYGDPREVTARVLGIVIGTGILYGYTGWIGAGPWASLRPRGPISCS